MTQANDDLFPHTMIVVWLRRLASRTDNAARPFILPRVGNHAIYSSNQATIYRYFRKPAVQLNCCPKKTDFFEHGTFMKPKRYLNREATIKVMRLMARCREIQKIKSLAVTLQISEDTLSGLLAGKTALSKFSTAKIMTLIGLNSEADFIRDLTQPEPQDDALRSELPLGMACKTELKTIYTMETQPTEDIKNILVDKKLSNAFLEFHRDQKMRLPSLQEAVSASQMFQGEKDTPKSAGEWGYKHFLQIGMILDVTWAGQGEPFFVGYPRLPKGETQYRHTSARFSCLWAASLRIKTNDKFQEFLKEPMSEWLYGESRTNRASEAFLEGDNAYFKRLMKYKINLQDLNLNTVPFGIITNDQRDADTKRVYTQYVFRATVQWPITPEDEKSVLEGLCMTETCIRLPNKLDPNKEFVTIPKSENQDGKPLRGCLKNRNE